jgi:hypothetical protein
MTLQDTDEQIMRLGWGLVFEGCLSADWRFDQQSNYERKGSRRSGFRWASSMVIQLRYIAWEMWEQRNHMEHKRMQELLEETLTVDVM